MSNYYTKLRRQLRVPEITNRFTYADMIFQFRVVNGLIECPDILSEINFSIPPKTLKSAALFKQSFTGQIMSTTFTTGYSGKQIF